MSFRRTALNEIYDFIVDYCIATGNLSDDEILEKCKRFKKMLGEF